MRRPRLPRLRRKKRDEESPEAISAPEMPAAPRRNPVGAIGRGARTAAYAAQDLVFLLGRVPRGIGRGAKGFWFGLSLQTRRRLALAILGAGLAAGALAVIVPRLPCQFPGGDVCPPSDAAAELVPSDALAYAHLSLEEGSDQYEEGAALLESLPQISREALGPLLGQLPGPDGQVADFERDIAPWLGEQAAVAVIPAAGAPERVLLFEEGDREGATEFAAALAGGEAAPQEYEGVELSVAAGGLATASVEGFLAVGTEEGVRRVIDIAGGAEGERPLAEEPVASELREDLPPERFADAFISRDGIESLVAEETAPLASAEPFIDAATSAGAAASLGAVDGALELAVRSELDPERTESNPGFFTAFPAFDPELPDRLAEDALGYVGIGDPGTTVSELFAQATAEAPVFAEALSAAIDRLRDLGDVNVQDQLLPALGGEAAFTLQPGTEPVEVESEETTTAPPAAPDGLPDDAETAPVTEAPVPILQFVADGVDSEAATNALARLQKPISEALDPGTTLQAPVFNQREHGGVQMQVLRVSPTVNLSYAVAGDNLAIATQPEGVEQVIDGVGGLSDTGAYEDATSGFPEESSLLAYFNVAELVRLAEREGLAEDPVYALLAAEVRRLVAAALSVEAAPTSLATDARLVVEPADDEGDEDGGEPAVESEEPPAE